MMIILILLILFLLYKTGELEQMSNKFKGDHQENDAKRFIDLRLAKGEISIEEYSRLKSVL